MFHTAAPELPRVSIGRELSQQIRAYFFRPSLAFSIALIIGTLPLLIVPLITFWIIIGTESYESILFGVLISTPFVLPFVAAICWTIAPFLYREARAVSDDHFDRVLEYAQNILIDRGLRKLQLNTAPEASLDLTLQGPPLVLLTGIPDIQSEWDIEFEDSRPAFVEGTDRNERFRIYRLCAVYPAQHHLGYYKCDFNIETGLILHEVSIDCHFKDVVALICGEYAQRVVPFPRWWVIIEELLDMFKIFNFFFRFCRRVIYSIVKPSDFVIRRIEIALNSGEKLLVPYFTKGMTPGAPTDGSQLTEATVRQVRQLLREKRMQLVRSASV